MRFEVQYQVYGRNVETLSKHRSAKAACNAMASIISGRKYRLRNPETCLLWDSHSDYAMPLKRARELIAAGGL